VKSIDRPSPLTDADREANCASRGRSMRDVPPRTPTPRDVRDVLWYALYDAAQGQGLDHEALARAVDQQLSALLAPEMARWLSSAVNQQVPATPHLATPEVPPARAHS
jgi:hypothetical protein